MCARLDSNQGPIEYKSIALPLSYGRIGNCAYFTPKQKVSLGARGESYAALRRQRGDMKRFENFVEFFLFERFFFDQCVCDGVERISVHFHN